MVVITDQECHLAWVGVILIQIGDGIMDGVILIQIGDGIMGGVTLIMAGDTHTMVGVTLIMVIIRGTIPVVTVTDIMTGIITNIRLTLHPVHITVPGSHYTGLTMETAT